MINWLSFVKVFNNWLMKCAQIDNAVGHSHPPKAHSEPGNTLHQVYNKLIHYDVNIKIDPRAVIGVRVGLWTCLDYMNSTSAVAQSLSVVQNDSIWKWLNLTCINTFEKPCPKRLKVSLDPIENVFVPERDKKAPAPTSSTVVNKSSKTSQYFTVLTFKKVIFSYNPIIIQMSWLDPTDYEGNWHTGPRPAARWLHYRLVVQYMDMTSIIFTHLSIDYCV